MKTRISRLGMALAVLLLMVSPLMAQEAGGEDTAVTSPTGAQETPSPAKKSGFEKYLQFNGVIQSVFVYRNDYDFDPTPRYYDVHGQSVGVLGTYFKPQLSLFPTDELRIFWEMELGLNLWSRHNPDQYQTGNFDTFKFAHRELYVEGAYFDNYLGFKVGYQFFEDPTRLFLGHWIGAASVSSDARFAKFTLSMGQIPGQTHEGVTLDSNNFRHDTFVYGLRIDVPLEQWSIAFSTIGLYDGEIVGQPLHLATPSVRVAADYEWVDFGLDLAMQAGKTRNGAAFGDERTLAWALQAFAEFRIQRAAIEFNQLVLSADDSRDRNGRNNAFFYSGKSKSRTMILSEDEIRDQGYNLDEFLAQKRNAFHLVRPGLSLTDVTFSYNVADIFVPAVVVGAGFVLEPENAMGSSLVGVETDLVLEFRHKDILAFHLVGGLLFPGGAAAAYVNLYDRTATQMQYTVTTSLTVSY